VMSLVRRAGAVATPVVVMVVVTVVVTEVVGADDRASPAEHAVSRASITIALIA